MNTSIKISIVTPAFNCADFLQECIESVLAQNYQNLEHIIIDGASTDGTVKLLKKYSHLTWISEPDHGEAEALNKALRMASGDIIGWIGADDRYSGTHVFHHVASKAAALSGSYVLYGKGLFIDESGEAIRLHIPKIPITLPVVSRWFSGHGLFQPSMFYSKQLLDEMGEFREDLPYGIDYEFWLRISSRGKGFHYIDHILGESREGARAESKSVTAPFEIRANEWTKISAGYQSQLTPCEQTNFWKDYFLYRINSQSQYSEEINIPEQKYELLGLAGALDLCNHIPGIQAVYEHLVRRYPDCEDIYWLLASCLARNGRSLEAKEILEQRIRAILSQKNHELNHGGSEVNGVGTKKKHSKEFASQLEGRRDVVAPELPLYPKQVTTPNSNSERSTIPIQPLVSVIIPTFNRPKRLVEAVESVLAQTYAEIEVLVINDGGCDVEPLLSSLPGSEKILYLCIGQNRERSHARNLGLKLAQGKYIAYLDDDDRFYPNHVETLVTFLECSDYLVAYTDAHRTIQVKENGHYIEKERDVPYSVDFNCDVILRQNFIPILCLMHAKSCIDLVGGFDEALSTHEDWDLVIRLSRCFSIHHIKSVTSEFSWRTDGTSTTSQRPADFLRTKEIILKKYRSNSPQESNGGNSSGHIPPQQDSGYKFYDCSIVIPVSNLAELTEQCLSQLVKVTNGVNYEVIVVDNGSTDETPAFLASLSGDVQIITNRQNLGFAKACNQGARIARGKYLVFLNNDTIPKSGWLDSLVEEVVSHHDVAVVGSKLLFPDDTIQHAGIVFNRARGLPYQWGRGQDSHSPIYNHRREFQAVTGACLLVRRETFERVNGFDENFVNGYEDVDLCLKIRELGGRIIYQPKSCLYHLEGQSSGRQDHMKENTDQFLSRWGKVWLEDEDIVADEEQRFMNPHIQRNHTALPPGHMVNQEEQSQRQLVVEVQKNLLGHLKGHLSEQESMVHLDHILAEYNRWPADTEILMWAGMVCQDLGFHQHGLGFFRRILQVADNPSIRIQYVQAAIKTGCLEEAQEHLTVLKQSGSFGKEECLVQGVLFLQVKEFLEAQAMFHLVLAEDITHIRARLGLGMAELAQGFGESAFASFQTVLTQCPDHREAIGLLLQAGTQLEDWARLSYELEKFHIRNPGDCDIRFALASVYLRMGVVEKAKSQYETLQVLAKDYVGLEDLAARLSQLSITGGRTEESQNSDDQNDEGRQRQVQMQEMAKANVAREQLSQNVSPSSSEAVGTCRSERRESLLPAILQGPQSLSSGPVAVCSTIPQLRRRVSVIANDPCCGGLRLLYPLRLLLAKNKLTGQVLFEGDILEGNVDLPVGRQESIVVQKIVGIVEPRLKEAKLQGTRIIHDCDDLLWKIPQDNQNFQIITRQKLDCFFRVMAQADCVTVSTEPLREALLVLGIPATVLPNCLYPGDWNTLTTQRSSGRRPRVGWVGQVGVHREDVAILLPLMAMLGQEVEWVFLGETPEVPSGVQCDVETHARVPLEAFPAKLASLNLDLALAPLVLNEFNEAKSDLRILQYGILGYPVVASDIIPYQLAPVTRVSNDPEAWARAIREHINNPDSSEAQGETLRQWVLSHRMFDQWASHYLAAWLGEAIEEKQIPESENIPRFSPQEKTPSLSERGKVSFDCSIIIPVFNKLELTRQCLTRLAEVTHGCSYEVVVVDNASTDETGLFLSSLEGDIHIVTNDSNLGFAKACNQGARVAKGKYLVFLNNDTIPQEGWLSALVDEVEQHPEVAIVGSKLLYPNNTIQHAGVVFSKKNLMPYLLFKNAPSDCKAANIRQEFQAVTAACFLIRKEDFEFASGFDEGFMNGLEDVDLCLKIRESGRKVIYQPKSVVYHLEEQTSGRKDPETERHNGVLFMDRWAEKIVVDEDYYTVSAGYASRYSSAKGVLTVSLMTFENEVEKSQWEQVKTVQRLLLKRRYDSSQSLYEQIDATIRTNLSDVSNWPEDSDTLKWAATICERLHCVESECAFLKRVLGLEEDSVAREKLATQALKHGALSEASQHVQALLALKPHDGPGLWLQGILAMQSLEYTKAVESFQQAFAVGYDEKKTGLGLGMAWMGVGDAAKSWDAFHSVMMAHPDNQDAVNGLLQSGTALQRWDELIDQLMRYVDRNPANIDLRFALAGVAFRAGQLEQAQQHVAILRLLNQDFEGLEDLTALLENAPTQSMMVVTG